MGLGKAPSFSSISVHKVSSIKTWFNEFVVKELEWLHRALTSILLNTSSVPELTNIILAEWTKVP